jgi:hypothetical protein
MTATPNPRTARRPGPSVVWLVQSRTDIPPASAVPFQATVVVMTRIVLTIVILFMSTSTGLQRDAEMIETFDTHRLEYTPRASTLPF